MMATPEVVQTVRDGSEGIVAGLSAGKGYVDMSTATVNSAPPMPPCPSTPNCISSQADDTHRIDPFRIAGDANAAFDKLRQLLAQRSDTTVISPDDTTIKVEFRTTLGFVDDGLFVLDGANNLIHVRSAARLGYWDLGKNRLRMEEIRQSFFKDQR